MWSHRSIAPLGIGACLTWAEVGALVELVNQFQVRQVVELGVLSGGLAALLHARTHYDPGFTYLGVEINESVIHPAVRTQLGPQILIADCRSAPAIAAVTALVQRPGVSFIFCDNGDKPAELERYWPLLKPGDLIAAHDYNPQPGPDVEIDDQHITPLLGQLQRERAAELADTRLVLLRRI